MAEWRKEGLIGVLIDILYAIDTPYEHKLFYSFQKDDNEQLPRPDFKVLDVKNPVKTRWNSFLEAFERAVDLQGPINAWVEYHIDKWNKEAAKQRAIKAKTKQSPRYVNCGGLTSNDWDVIRHYIKFLTPLREATKKLEARGKAGCHGAIWAVI